MNKKIFLSLVVFLFVISPSAQTIFNVKNYGAKGDGKTNDAVAIQKAIDVCTAKGGGRVLLPAGNTFIAGPFQLKSFVELYVETGAILKASSNEKLYMQSAFKENKGEGSIWIGGQNLQQVSICGGGIIDGNGISFMGKEMEDAFELKPFDIFDPRPHLLLLVGCKNINIHNISFRDAAYWTLHLAGCNDAAITDVTILNSLKVRNCDGIDLNHSKNIRINNCFIESGDDCICLKNRREYAEYGTCENITVNNCTMSSSSCAIKIGSENMDTIRRVVFNNCIITNSNRGVGIQHRDEGMVTDVIFSNMIIESHLFSDVWWGKAEPIAITAFKRASVNGKDANWRFPKGATEGKVGEVKNIFFTNIQCKSENGVFVSGESVEKISAIYFDNIKVSINKTTTVQGGLYDRRPSNTEPFSKGVTAGFYFDNATQISVNNCTVEWGNNKPVYFGYALQALHIKGIAVKDLRGEHAFDKNLSATKIIE